MDVCIVAHTRGFQADALERNAFEVLELDLSMMNSLAPINRIPPDVFSMIPGYCDEDEADEVLIALTHVCRGWRNMLTSCSSLWAQLDFKSIDKTRTYIQRSRSSPLKLLYDDDSIDDAFDLIIPHIPRLKSLTIMADELPDVLEPFRCRTPLLEKLGLYTTCPTNLDDEFFDGDLSSLRELYLGPVVTHLPWKNLANLRVVSLDCHPYSYGTTQILDFFESAPLLYSIFLQYVMPDSSDAPPTRIVHPRHLKVLLILPTSTYPVLLHHLHIPRGASLISNFRFRGEESPFLDYLPKLSPNFSNLAQITAINLRFDPKWKCVRLSGPSGSLRVLTLWDDWGKIPPHAVERQILLSLGDSMLSTIQKLTVTNYTHPRPAEAEECPISQTLSSVNNLRTLTLTKCNNLPFILALDPEQNPSNLVLCPNMEDLALYNKKWDRSLDEPLITMARDRASRGAKLSSITFVLPGGLPLLRNSLFETLGEHVTRVHWGPSYHALPAWDYVPGVSIGEGESWRLWCQSEDWGQM